MTDFSALEQEETPLEAAGRFEWQRDRLRHKAAMAALDAEIAEEFERAYRGLARIEALGAPQPLSAGTTAGKPEGEVK